MLAAAGIEPGLHPDPALKIRPQRLLTRQRLYLIFKQALPNVVKHAGATEVQVGLRPAGDQLCLEVRDNGPRPPPRSPATACATCRCGP